DSTRQMLIDRLNRVSSVEIVRTYAERGTMSPPIAVVRMSDENAGALRLSAGRTLVIEPDQLLRAASFAGLSQPRPTAPMTASGPAFTATFKVASASGQPVEHAEVELVGEQDAARGLTDKEGNVALTLHGELPETVSELFVKPRSGC